MSFEFQPAWTTEIAYPDKQSFICPTCGMVAFNIDDVTECLYDVTTYEVRHIPPVLIFTCDNPDCADCDKDFEYSLSVKIKADPVPF